MEEGDWCTRAVSERYGVGLWKAIRNEWLFLKSRLAYQVDNGRRVKFWKDKWCGDKPFCESFPSLYSISLSKDAWVSDVWNLDSDGEGWAPLFSRAFNDWEIEMVERFMLKIKAFKVQREDEVEWFGRLQRVVISQSSCCILYRCSETLICSLVIVFGE